MRLNDIRKKYEFELLPELFFEDAEEFFHQIYDYERNFFYDTFLVQCELAGISCPYGEIDFIMECFDEDDGSIKTVLTMPAPTQEGQCSRIIFFCNELYQNTQCIAEVLTNNGCIQKHLTD